MARETLGTPALANLEKSLLSERYSYEFHEYNMIFM